MKTPAKILLLAIAACLPLSGAQAHRQWLLPSATVLSGDNVWVTVDAAVSNDLFYFEHVPMRLDNLAVLAPDGSATTAENQSTGKYRSTFDVPLKQKGTYKIAILNSGLFASYKVDGQQKRWRGLAANYAKEVPANAEDLRVTEMQGRLEVFVTNGKPTATVLQPTNVGLELLPVTHPNDLVVGDPATFRMLLDGKPAAGLKVTVIPGGIRYRDNLQEKIYTTDADGKIELSWTQPGMYWINASVQDDKSEIKDARRRAAYTATLEVLPQ